MAAEAWQGELAFEIIDVMASEYRIPAAAMKAEIIEQAAKNPRSLPQRKAVAAAALEVLDEAIAADDFDAAREMGKQAMLMARPTKMIRAYSGNRDEDQGYRSGREGQ